MDEGVGDKRGGENIKADVVIWTKNGKKTLHQCLESVEKALGEIVHRKIAVDGHSRDRTVEILREFNWEVYENPDPLGRIPGGANEALRHVDCDFFVSIEQDVVLCENFWDKVFPLLEDEKTIVASGIRLPDKPEGLRKLYEYVFERYMRNPQKWVRSAFLGVTLDNTIYKTKAIRMLGGFPDPGVSGGVDGLLAKNVFSSGYLWRVNPEAVSTHLRGSTISEVKHWYYYGKCSRALGGSLLKIAAIAGFSPVRGAYVAWKKRSPSIIYIYPAMRWAMLAGAIASYL
jgi:GT2 family glycosyltransferase